MGEMARIREQIDRAFKGPAWSGPSVMEVLDGVDAIQAARRPIAAAHSIWEITLHIGVWEDVVRRRALGEPFNPTDEQDWPKVTEITPQAWKATLKALQTGHQALLGVVAAFDEKKLDQPLVKGGSTGYVQFHGAAQHDLYHAGQIAVLKKG
jgi:hypothetical protein